MNKKNMAIRPSLTHSSMLMPRIGRCQKCRNGSPKEELAMDSETRVQSRIRIPLDFSELKKRSKVAEKGLGGWNIGNA
jgi:hypothetical protein